MLLASELTLLELEESTLEELTSTLLLLDELEELELETAGLDELLSEPGDTGSGWLTPPPQA